MKEILEWQIEQCMLCREHRVGIVLPSHIFPNWHYRKIHDMIDEIAHTIFPQSGIAIHAQTYSSFTFDNGSRIDFLRPDYYTMRGKRYDVIFVHESIPSKIKDVLKTYLYPDGRLLALCLQDEEYPTNIPICTEEEIYTFLGITQ